MRLNFKQKITQTRQFNTIFIFKSIKQSKASVGFVYQLPKN